MIDPKDFNEALIALKLTRTERDTAREGVHALRNAVYNLLERPRAQESRRSAEQALVATNWAAYPPIEVPAAGGEIR